MNAAKLLETWVQRGAREPGWFKSGYESAVQRVEDHTSDPENPYWHGPSAAMDAFPDSTPLYDEMGGQWSVEDVRKMAFELLVLADLAETSS